MFDSEQSFGPQKKITTFHPAGRLKFNRKSASSKNIYKKPLIISYKKGKSLKDVLTI